MSPQRITRLRWIVQLGLRDLLHGWPTTLCLAVAIATALLPLLILFGLKFGVVSNLVETLRSDPSVREIRLSRDVELAPAWFERLATRDDVAFLLPRTNFLSASVVLRAPGSRSLLDSRMVPTAPGDPLISGLAVPEGLGEIAMSERVAIATGTAVGDEINVVFDRTVDGRIRGQKHPVTVVSIVPRDRLQTDDILVSPQLENAVEAWRQGFAVPQAGWLSTSGGMTPEQPERLSFSSFRLYARDVRDVPGLRDLLLAEGLDIRTRAEEVVRVLVIERALTLTFLVLSVLGAVGFLLTLGLHLAASVAEKARELAILRLLGLGSLEAALMPSFQGLAISGAGAALACLVAVLGQPAVNSVFGGIGGLEGRVSMLTTGHLAAALAITTAAGGIAGSAGGLRAALIEPRRGLRHD